MLMADGLMVDVSVSINNGSMAGCSGDTEREREEGVQKRAQVFFLSSLL